MHTQSTITSNEQLMPDTYLMWLEAPEIASAARPGQFVMVGCGEEHILRRPLSIHRVEHNSIALLFANVGKGTEWLSHCKAGAQLDLLGPLGNGFTLNPESKNLLLVAGGIGIAPLVFLADEAIKKSCSVTLLLGARTAECLYPANLLPRGIKTIVTTDDGTAGRKGFVANLLPEFLPAHYIPSPSNSISPPSSSISLSLDGRGIKGEGDTFLCGPLAMYLDMNKRYSRLLKNKAVQVSLEVRMGCGLGVCYSCTIKTTTGLKQVCKDGPVFDFNTVVWSSLA